MAATVLSMNHVIALRKTSESTVPGAPPKFVGVIEQRVTGIVIFVLIGCSIFFSSFLTVSIYLLIIYYLIKRLSQKLNYLIFYIVVAQLIPMAVLYAIFMYMGVTPMSELEFYQRIQLMFMPKKLQPDLVYLRHVRLHRVHLFTAIQIACLVALFALKLNKTISISFPLMVNKIDLKIRFKVLNISELFIRVCFLFRFLRLFLFVSA